MGDIFREHRQHRQGKHREWRRANMEVVGASGFPYAEKNGGEQLVFDAGSRGKVSFYPSTGRWYAPWMKRAMSGGAKKFLKWLSEHNGEGGRT